MTKKIKITIPAGTVSADLPFYCLYVDFAQFPASFFTDSYNNGADIRAYAADGTTRLPAAKLNRYSTVTKTGGMYIRTPVSAASDTIVYVAYNTLGLSAVPKTEPFGAYDCFEGFAAFAHVYGYEGFSLGYAALVNLAGPEVFESVGTLQDGDGPNDCFTFSGSGGYYRVDLDAPATWTLGVAAIRNPGMAGDMTATAFGEELRFKADDVAAAVYNATDGYYVGSAYTLGAKTAIGVTYGTRDLFTNGDKVTDPDGTATLTPTQFSIGATPGGDNKLRGAIRHAFVYDGILPDAYFEMENYVHGDAVATPPDEDGDLPEIEPVFLFVGTSLADIYPLGTPIVLTGSANLGPNVLEGIQVGNYHSNGARCEFSEIVDEFYGSWYWWPDGPTSTGSPIPIEIQNEDKTQILIRIVCGNSVVHLDIWDGSAYTRVVSNVALTATGGPVRAELFVRRHATAGRFRLVVAGVPLFDFTGDTDGGGDFSAIDFTSTGSGKSYISSMIFADTPTASYNFRQLALTGNGANTGWTGDYTSVDETAYDDADYIEAAAPDLVETFTAADMASPADASTYVAVVISGRMSAGPTAPVDIEGVVRVGGVDYTAPAELALTTSLAPNRWIFETNPATGQYWIGTEINAAEFGVKSKA